MKKLIYILFAGVIMLFTACEDDYDKLVKEPNDITLNELQLAKFTHVIPDGGFKSGGITFNTKKNSDGTFSGFAYSRRSNRSFTWSGTDAALDSNRFSVYTPRPNQTEVYAVACVKDDDVYFTLDKATVVEHILVANTTYAYFAMNYGKDTGPTPIANPNVPSAPKGIWQTYAPGVERALNLDGDYFKLIIKGFLGDSHTGTVEFYLCCRKGADPANPTFNFLRSDWIKADLQSLGVVDKVVFNVECSYRDNNQQSLIPAWFCLDGIRLQK